MPKEYFYSRSKMTALQDGQMDIYGQSFQSNLNFKAWFERQMNGIADTAFDNGNNMAKFYAQKAVDEWGFDRTLHMLANAVWNNRRDNQYSKEIKDWAREMFSGRSMDDTQHYTLGTSPKLIESVAREVRGMYQALNLFNASHCEENRNVDFENNIQEQRNISAQRTPEDKQSHAPTEAPDSGMDSINM